METTSLLSVARQWWWTIVLATVLAGAAGALFTSAMPVSHEARVRMLVGQVSGDNDALRAASQLTRTYAELVTGESVVDGTIDSLGLGYPQEQVRAAIRPTADSATRMLIIRVRDADADLAAEMANEVASQLSQVTSVAGTTDGSSGLIVIDRAAPGTPVGVPTAVIVGLAAFAGLIGALALVLLLENLDQSIRGPEELSEVSGADYLGTVVPSVRRGPAATRGFVVETAPDSSTAADYRMLATKIELISPRDGIHSLLVLGVGEAQGGGELAANIAKVLAERRHCVTLLDANPHSREITDLLSLHQHPGLTDLLERSERPDEEEVHPGGFTYSPDPGLFVMPFGLARGPLSPHTTGAPWLLERLLRQADFLLVNAAPAHLSAATLVWAGAVDATLLVVPRHGTQRGELSHLMESLRLVGANPIGVVFEERRRLVWLGRRRDPSRAPAPLKPPPEPVRRSPVLPTTWSSARSGSRKEPE